MKKQGFTLMELLLVVAILAIVAAAAAPTFSKGAADAMMEARKSNYYSAYQNAVSGANMMMAIQTAQGLVAKQTTGNLDAKTIENTNASGTAYLLDHYSPKVGRVFSDITGNFYAWTARVTASQTVEFMMVSSDKEGTIAANASSNKLITPTDNPSDKLSTYWNNGTIGTISNN